MTISPGGGGILQVKVPWFTHSFVEAVKQETAAFVADASPNRKQFPWDNICGSMELDTGNYLTQLASVGYPDFACLPGSGKIFTK